MNNTNGSTINQKKIKRKFNIVDFLVLILIVAIIGLAVYAVIYWTNVKSLWATNTMDDFQYAVELRGVDQEFVDKINNGDTVIDGVSKNQLGTVDRVDKIEKYTSFNNGALVEHPDKFNITVYISTPAEYEEGVGYTVNGRRIAVGEIIEMRFPEFSSVAYCVAGNFN